MGPRELFDTDRVQAIRDRIATDIKELEELSASQPEYGQYLTFAKNHLRLGFMELGYGSALTKGYDPLANKIEEKK